MELDAIFASVPVIETSRLILRGIRESDAEAIFATFSDPQTLEFYDALPHQSVEESRELIREIAGWYARREGIRWGITLRGADEVIGACGLFKFDEGFHRAETGYELRRAYWRQGIMSEALGGVLAFGFNEMGLHRIEAVTDEGNVRSRGLLLKLGFTHEGALRQRFAWQGRFLDEHYFGLLRDEWRG
ncbi:MAG TPA: GNAT family protein [Ktedonobacterales bacterium]